MLQIQDRNEKETDSTSIRVAILEFAIGGGLGISITDGVSSHDESVIGRSGFADLAAEGLAMSTCLISDMTGLKNAEVHCVWDTQLGACPFANVVLHPTRTKRTLEELLVDWGSVANLCDVAVIIAPESNGLLHDIIESMRSGTCRLLNCSPEFIAAGSDKWESYERLNGFCRQPNTVLGSSFLSSPKLLDDRNGLILKPRDGVGSDSVQFFASHSELQIEMRNRYRKAFDTTEPKKTDLNRLDQWLVQEFVPGIAGSISIVCGRNSQIVLPTMTQRIERDALQCLRYTGSDGYRKLIDDDESHLLAKTIVQHLPGTPLGWIGIDFVASANGPIVIEVNPRLTSSYIGLRKIVDRNLAAKILEADTAHFEPFNYPIQFKKHSGSFQVKQL